MHKCFLLGGIRTSVGVVVAHIYPPVTGQRLTLLDDPHTFHCIDYFLLGRIRTSLGVSIDPMFFRVSSKSCLLNLLLVRSHQAQLIVVKRLIQGRNNVTRMGIEPTSCDHGRRKTTPLPSRPRCRRFKRCNVSVDFFEILFNEFAACSKPPSRDDHREASYPRTQQHDQSAG